MTWEPGGGGGGEGGGRMGEGGGGLFDLSMGICEDIHE